MGIERHPGRELGTVGTGSVGAMKRALAVLAVAVVVIACAGAGWWWTHREDKIDPQTVRIPAPQKATETRVFLNGDGKVLVKFLNTTDDLSATAGKSDCEKLITDELTALGSPPKLAALAQQVPDPTLRDAFQNHVRTVSVYLSACGTSKGLAGAAEQVTFTAVVAHRQIDKVSR
jgi:hypothetical protein